MAEDQTSNYVLMVVADIAAGRVDPAVRAGWAMGPFFPPDDLRCTNAFEIKNWDQNGVRSEWRNHAKGGSEYILVTQGMLTVVLGGPPEPDGTVIETERVLVPAGHVIGLRAGQWRRYECTPDAQGVTVRRPSSYEPHAEEKVPIRGANASSGWRR